MTEELLERISGFVHFIVSKKLTPEQRIQFWDCVQAGFCTVCGKEHEDMCECRRHKDRVITKD